MAFWDFLYKEIGQSGLLNQTKEQNELIEGVLFDIWMRGHLERSPIQSSASPLLSMIIGFFLSIISLPFTFAKMIPEIFFSAVAAGFLYLAWPTPSAAISVFFLCLIFLYRESFLRFLRNFIFDIADILLLGRLTARKLTVIQACGPMKRFRGDKFLEHLFVSRILSSGPLRREADSFQHCDKLLQNDWPQLNGLIEGYWNGGRFDSFYWGEKLKYLRVS